MKLLLLRQFNNSDTDYLMRNLADKYDIINAATPNYKKSYTVIPHREVIDNTINLLNASGFVITDEQYRCTDEAQIAQGIYYIKPKNNYMTTIESKTIPGMHLSITSRYGYTDRTVSNIKTLVTANDGTQSFGSFNYYYLTNKAKSGGSFLTCGAVKLVLYLIKRNELNKQVPAIQDGSYSNLLLKNSRYFNDRRQYQMIVLDSAMSTSSVTYGSTPTTVNSRLLV